MFNKNLLNKTGQAWKFYISCPLFIAGGILFKYGETGHPFFGLVPLLVCLIGIGIALFGLAFPWIYIRCPICRVHWMRLKVRAGHPDSSDPGLFGLIKCQKCGFDGTAPLNSQLPTHSNFPEKQKQN